MYFMFLKDCIKHLSQYKLSSHIVRQKLKDKEECFKMDWNESSYDNMGLKEFLTKKIHSLPINYYPNTNNIELLDKIWDYINTNTENILYYNGSDDALDNVCELFDFWKNKNVWTLNPSYDNFRIYVEKKWWELIYLNVIDFSQKPSIDEISSFIKDHEIILFYLISPHNPIGFSYSEEELNALISNNSNCFFIVDQAYIEFSNIKFSYNDFINCNNVLFVRTFSKALWLAWLRLWYVISSKDIILCLSKYRNPKSINLISQEAWIYILNNLAPICEYINSVNIWKGYLYKFFQDKHIEYIESDANFLLFKIWYESKNNLKFYLESRNIFIRFLDNPLLKDWVRVSIPQEEKIKKFIDVLNEFFVNEK